LFDEEQFENGIEIVASAGFDGIEIYGFENHKDNILEKCREHGLEWIYLSGDRPDFTDPANHEAALDNIRRSLQIAEKINCKYINVKSGKNQKKLDFETQRRSVIKILQTAAPFAEKHDITLVLEPLNATVDHPSHFTNTIK
jgi:hydroxypyruvate isomerase